MDEPIVCDISVDGPMKQSNDEEPLSREQNRQAAFEALSYVWGDKEPLEHIYCDGETVDVRPNLFLALRRLRSPTESRRLWVDAICIDQSDDKEKNEQVARMGSIYRAASRTLIWVGEDTGSAPEDRLVFDFVRQAENICDQRPPKTDPKEFTRRLDDLCDALFNEVPERGDEEYQYRTWNSDDPLDPQPLRDFLCKPWFSRRWVVQEVYCSQSALLVCGANSIDWTQLARFVCDFLQLKDWRTTANLNLNDTVGTALELCILETIKADEAFKGLNFVDILDMFQDFKCSDERDQIWALLELAKHLSPPVQIQPSYECSRNEAFSDFARLMIERGYVSWILDAAAHRLHSSRIEDPLRTSWVPDWTLNTRLGPWFSFNEPGLSERKHSTVSGSFVSVDGDWLMLHHQAVLCDSVQAVRSTQHSFFSDEVVIDTTLGFEGEVRRSMGPEPGDVVCFFQGMRIPMLLRAVAGELSCPRTFRLVGPCDLDRDKKLPTYKIPGLYTSGRPAELVSVCIV